MRRILSALPLAGLFLVNSASAATVISTYPVSFFNYAWEFGNGGSATGTYGQTFVAPADKYLVSYTSSFGYVSGDAFKFRLYIAPWDEGASKVAGAPIFESLDLISASLADGFKSYAVPMSVRLTPGSKYVAFYSSTDTDATSKGSMKMALADYTTDPAYDAYSGGAFYYNTALTKVDVLSNTWSTYADITDTAFTASFSAVPRDTVPEPASLLALGAGALAFVRRRRAR